MWLGSEGLGMARPTSPCSILVLCVLNVSAMHVAATLRVAKLVDGVAEYDDVRGAIQAPTHAAPQHAVLRSTCCVCLALLEAAAGSLLTPQRLSGTTHVLGGGPTRYNTWTAPILIKS